MKRDFSTIDIDDLDLPFAEYVWQGSRKAFGQKSKTVTCIDLCATFNDDKIDDIGYIIPQLFGDLPRFIDEALADHVHNENRFEYEISGIKPGTLPHNNLDRKLTLPEKTSKNNNICLFCTNDSSSSVDRFDIIA